ncbi:hypothetical protein [Actinoplanes sp. NBRC 103695]|uniref:hypothetical protein n=1 Tax=Actinoplanes sp. NBRC 103695 TaxID=3032202 RepID=UPI0025564A65|nr:hypothetical protein [Actinoplanes sp. NBRC 103695]
MAGRVGVARLATRGLLLLGCLLVVHLNRRRPAEKPAGPGTSPAPGATNEGQTFRENGSHAYR